MQRSHLVLGLGLFLSLMCACDGDDPSGDYGPHFDAQRASDGGTHGCLLQTKHHLSCNPVTQAGCEFGEKCALLIESEEPYLSRTACVPEGEALPGGACNRGPAGACTGFDNCIAGFHCLENTCTRICDLGPPDSCREGFEPFGTGAYCTTFERAFYDAIGVCVNACNPANDQVTDAGTSTNTDCELGEACVVNSTLEAAVCLPPDATGL